MDTFLEFKDYLFSQNPRLSTLTVKNYLSDLTKFFTWYSSTYAQPFATSSFTNTVIESYRLYLLHISSSERYLSSLRKFGRFLVETHAIPSAPLSLQKYEEKAQADQYDIQAFRNFLSQEKNSDVTITNYIADIQQFITWLISVQTTEVQPNEFHRFLSGVTFDAYKHRMMEEGVATSTINRKLSSLRKYIDFLQRIYPDTIRPIATINIPYSVSVTDTSFPDISPLASPSSYSSFAPLRLLQKIKQGILTLFDVVCAAPIANAVLSLQYSVWRISGKKLFVPGEQIDPQLHAYIHSRRKKSKRSTPYSSTFFAPLSSNRSWFSERVHKYRLFLQIHPFFSLVQTGMLLLILFAILTYSYDTFISPLHSTSQVLGISTNQRLVSFSGTLINQANQPITVPTPVRFSLYTDPVASKSALVWQEVRMVTPRQDGSFQMTLGNQIPIASSIFSENPDIYLGTTIANSPELRPRSAIPTVGLSSDSQTLEGMHVLTDNANAPRNTILALDSTGSLRIGALSPTFSATNGTFTLSGQQVLLTTNLESNGNLVLNPNGLGHIDLQKPLENTGGGGNIPGFAGAVEVDDRFGVLATTSALPAFQVNQDFIGPLINASSSGVSKFLVDYMGSGTFANDLAVNGTNLTTTSPNFNLLATTVAQIQFGSEAQNISIGSSTGMTTLSGDAIVGGSTGLQFSSDGAGIQFGGDGNHVLIASSGALLLGSDLQVGDNVSIVPSSNDGTSNLGSDSNPFGTLYIQHISSLQSLTLSGNIGVGTTDPQFKLDVQDSQDAQAIASLKNSSISPNASVLKLQLGNVNTNLSTSNHFIDFVDTNGTSLGYIGASQNASGSGVLFHSNNADFAEYLPKNLTDTIPAASLVCLSSDALVHECDQTYSTIAGVVSASPTVLGGKDMGAGSVIVGLTGQLNVQVSTKNGPIQPGDPIAVSDIPGVGVKATSAGPIIGHALTSYANPNPYIIGTVYALVQPAWFDPSIQLTDSGNLPIILPSTSDASQAQPFQLVSIYNTVINATAAYSQAVIANLQAGNAHITQLFANSIVVGGTSLQDYITHVVEQMKIPTATTLVASIPSIQTNIISPLASNSAVLVQGNLQVSQNATVAGQLTAQTIQTQDATISGTLHVGKIYADEIIGPNATSSATDITPSTTPIPPSPSTSSAGLSVQALADQPIQTQPNYITLPDISLHNIAIDDTLQNTGNTSLGNTFVSGQLSLDNQLTLTDTSINLLGADLQIQPFRQGGVSFLSGLVTIDTSGNLSVQGNAVFAQNVTVQGNLATHVISPLANQDVTIGLSSASGSASQPPSFVVQNASGSSVFALNQQGSITASGSGNFAQVIAKAFTIVRGVQADTSTTQTIASASAGTAVIYAGQVERTIISPFVQAGSLIYITPVSNTYGISPYIARQTASQCPMTYDQCPLNQEGSFTIQISSPESSDIHLNWWIVN